MSDQPLTLFFPPRSLVNFSVLFCKMKYFSGKCLYMCRGHVILSICFPSIFFFFEELYLPHQVRLSIIHIPLQNRKTKGDGHMTQDSQSEYTTYLAHGDWFRNKHMTQAEQIHGAIGRRTLSTLELSWIPSAKGMTPSQEKKIQIKNPK